MNKHQNSGERPSSQLGPSGSVEFRELFLDRSEVLEQIDKHLRDVYSVQPGIAERINVFAVCGEAGIGKSALAKEVERRFQHGAIGPTVENRLCIRVDFSETELIDLESLLLYVRASLGSTGAKFRSFDLGLQAYWTLQYPGMPLEEFTTGSKWRRLTKELNLGMQVRSTVESLLTTVSSHLSGTSGTSVALVRKIYEFARANQTKRGMGELVRVLDLKNPDQIIADLPALMNHDLEPEDGKVRSSVLFLMDNFESVQSVSKGRNSPEELIRRMCSLMPNVAFLILGRNSLNWSNRRANEPRSGPHLWHQLASTDPNASMVNLDVLPLRDRLDYLERRAVRDGKPIITEKMRTEIADASDGLPLYLELFVESFVANMDGAENGIWFDSDELAAPTFNELAFRYLRDIEPEERRLVEAASLAGQFDLELLRAMTGDPRRVTERWMQKSLVRKNDSVPVFTHSLHPRFIEALLSEESAEVAYWNAEDRHEKAEDALEHLNERFGEIIRDPRSDEVETYVSVFRVALRLCGFVSDVPSWVLELAYVLRIVWRPEALRLRRDLPGGASEASLTLALIADSMADRCEQHHGDAERSLRTAIETIAEPNPLLSFARNRLGKVLEEVGRVDEAEVLLSLAASDARCPLLKVAQKDLARIRLQRGFREDAESWISENRESTSALNRRQALDLDGWVGFYFGELDRAVDAFEAEYRIPEGNMNFDIHHPTRHLLLALAWQRSSARAEEILPEAFESNEQAGQTVGLAQCKMANALLEAERSDWVSASRLLSKAQELLVNAGASNEFWMVLLTALGVSLSQKSSESIVRCANVLADELSQRRIHPQIENAARSVAAGALFGRSEVFQDLNWLGVWRRRLI